LWRSRVAGGRRYGSCLNGGPTGTHSGRGAAALRHRSGIAAAALIVAATAGVIIAVLVMPSRQEAAGHGKVFSTRASGTFRACA
jgi:hypothetical protein